MRRAAFVLWAAVALSRAVSGQQTTLLSPGVAAQGSIDPQTGSVFSFYANPGDAVLIRLLSLSQDYSLRFTVHNGATYSQPINPRPYSVPIRIPCYPPGYTADPSVVGVMFGGEYDLPGDSQGYYTIAVSSQNQVAGDFLLVYTSLTGSCSPSNPSCVVPPLLNCGVPAVNQQIGLPPPPPANPPQPASPWLQLNSYQFRGNPGDILSVRVAKYASQTMPLASGFNLRVLAYDSSGTILYPNPATVQFAAVQAGTRARRRRWTCQRARRLQRAPSTSLFSTSSDQTGNFGISVSTLNRPCSNKSLTCGSASQGKLASPLAIDSYKASVSSRRHHFHSHREHGRQQLLGAGDRSVRSQREGLLTPAQSVSTATFQTTCRAAQTIPIPFWSMAVWISRRLAATPLRFARLDVPCSPGGAQSQALSCGTPCS